ncbi:hypothetical protein DERP_002784 [Dermatophagoides pteronyssinus]|uniref:Uncharacterized protein n=1 Tax=Dermatophagoides pteronyssinus TaxID=6956 RepID=A0ABQ8JW93_DERPT|nr:hypothetical protein DERP_002784 [Dermatophagoides pteronyssinus]
MSKSNEQFDFSSSLSLTTIDDDNDDYAKSSYRRSNHQKRCWFWYDDCLNHWFKTISRTFILLIIIIIMSSLSWSTTNFVNCNVHSSSSYQFSYSSSSPLPSPTTTTTRKRSTILETKQIDQRIFVDKNIDIDDDIDGVRDNVALSSSSSTSYIS